MSNADIQRLAGQIERLRWANGMRTVQGEKRTSMEENAEYVRAVLTAMREPSEEMLLAALPALHDLHAPTGTIDGIWYAMIDSLLAD